MKGRVIAPLKVCTISIHHYITTIIGTSIDVSFVSANGWWMAASLPMNEWPPQLLGSCIMSDGTLYGGHSSFAVNLSQRPALDTIGTYQQRLLCKINVRGFLAKQT